MPEANLFTIHPKQEEKTPEQSKQGKKRRIKEKKGTLPKQGVAASD